MHDEMQQLRLRMSVATAHGGQAFPFDLFDLRGLDVSIDDDMLACLDALRWGHADLHRLVPDGDERVGAAIEKWALKWPEES